MNTPVLIESPAEGTAFDRLYPTAPVLRPADIDDLCRAGALSQQQVTAVHQFIASGGTNDGYQHELFYPHHRPRGR